MMGHVVNREGRRMNVVVVGPRQHDDVDADVSGAIIAMGRDGNADAEFLPPPTTKKRTRMKTPKRVRRRVDRRTISDGRRMCVKCDVDELSRGY